MRKIKTALVMVLAGGLLGGCGADSGPSNDFGPWQAVHGNDVSSSPAIAFLKSDGTVLLSTSSTVGPDRFMASGLGVEVIGPVADNKIQVHTSGHDFYVAYDQPFISDDVRTRVYMVRERNGKAVLHSLERFEAKVERENV